MNTLLKTVFEAGRAALIRELETLEFPEDGSSPAPLQAEIGPASVAPLPKATTDATEATNVQPTPRHVPPAKVAPVLTRKQKVAASAKQRRIAATTAKAQAAGLSFDEFQSRQKAERIKNMQAARWAKSAKPPATNANRLDALKKRAQAGLLPSEVPGTELIERAKRFTAADLARATELSQVLCRDLVLGRTVPGGTLDAMTKGVDLLEKATTEAS